MGIWWWSGWWWLVAMTGLWLSRNSWEWNVIIPTDFNSIIFQRGRYTTNQWFFWVHRAHWSQVFSCEYQALHARRGHVFRGVWYPRKMELVALGAAGRLGVLFFFWCVFVVCLLFFWMMAWVGVGWGGMLTFMWRSWCYVDHGVGWGEVGC